MLRQWSQAHLFFCCQQTYLTLASRRAELQGLQVNKMVLHRARPGLARVKLENLISTAAVSQDALPFLPATPGRLSIVPGKVGS